MLAVEYLSQPVGLCGVAGAPVMLLKGLQPLVHSCPWEANITGEYDLDCLSSAAASAMARLRDYLAIFQILVNPGSIESGNRGDDI